VLGAAGLIGLAAWRIWARVHELPEPPVTEPPGRFLWRPGEVWRVLTLPFATFAGALPTSLSVLLALRDARLRTDEDDLARAGAWASVLSLVAYTVIGVSNTRYAMPAVGVMPCLWGFVLRRHFERLPEARPLIDRFLMNRPSAWGALVLAGAIVGMVYTEHRRAERTSGKPAGVELGEALEDGELWGHEVMDRSEVLYYARERAAERGKHVRVRWVPPDHAGQGPLPVPPAGNYVVLLESPVAELERYEAAGLVKGLHEVYRGQAHKFSFRVYRVER
jgi:hypothetical protein